jgi:heme-degrading monooxygenase HmoA
MYARLSTYSGEPIEEQIDLAAGSTLPIAQLQEMAGFCGVYFLADRASGKTLTLTLWEDEAAMHASEAGGTRIRKESAERERTTIRSVERFEVGFAHLPEG